MNLRAADCGMTGDRPQTDVHAGRAAGMSTALMMTGTTSAYGHGSNLILLQPPPA